MTKQYRITTQNVSPVDDGDCFLSDDDPIQELKIASHLGGLGSRVKLGQYNELTQQKITDQLLDRRAQAQARGIRPGSPAWVAMFSK